MLGLILFIVGLIIAGGALAWCIIPKLGRTQRDIQGTLANLETVYWDDIQREVSNYFFTDTPEYEAMVRLVEASTQFHITHVEV